MRPELITTLNLNRLALLSGQGKRLEIEVSPGEVELGGHRYTTAPNQIPAQLHVSRTVAGYALRLHFSALVEGPCMRCLEPSSVSVEIDAREVDQPSDGPDGEDEEGELTSPYVGSGELRIEDWARDALVLGLPDQLLCRPECLGLCSVCGERLEGADPEAHRHEAAVDPRWAKLSQLDLDPD